MKTYVIILGKTFPNGHPRAGQDTHFKEKFLSGEKNHTIRSNYPLWATRIKEIREGEACLSVREWVGTPYRSGQTEIACLDARSGVGIQKANISVLNKMVWCSIGKNNASIVPITEVAKNDGLSEEDFIKWANWAEMSDQAIIWFNGLRYGY